MAGMYQEPEDEQLAAQRGNRRRLRVFALTLVLALIAGQVWNFSRPSEYLASTRLQVSLPDAAGPGPVASSAFTSSIQLFNSRPVLAQLATALSIADGQTSDAQASTVTRLQSMLRVLPVLGTDVVQVEAIGTDPAELPAILNALPDVVRADLAARQRGDADSELADARAELTRLARTTEARRQQLDSARRRAGLQTEREENEAVARSMGLNRSLSAAVEKEAAAAARLKAVRDAMAAGQTSSLVRADPSLTGLEARAHQTREELREMERGFTPDFMAMDPRARALRARLGELEKQIAQQRVISQQAAVQTAEEDHASAVAQVERLRNQLAAARPALAAVSSQLAETKTLEDDLQQLDKARRELLERTARLEANERRRMATVTVLEPAVAPTAPFRPDHGLDALYVTGVAFLIAVLVTGTTEWFNRKPDRPAAPASTTVVLSPGWGEAANRLPAQRDAAPLLSAGPGAWPAQAALTAPIQLLDQAQAAALLAAANGSARLVCAAGLMGLTADELLSLRVADLDLPAGQLRVPGAFARTLPLAPAQQAVWSAAAQDAPGPDTALLRTSAGSGLTEDDVQAMVVSASLDAGLPQGAALRWEALRHTCIDWLLGQGLRFSDLPRQVGRVDAELLAGFASRHGDVPRVAADEVDVLMPALRVAVSA